MFKPSFGFLTDYYRTEYIKSNLTLGAFKEEQIMSLNYKVNTSKRLYFWQLFSILGEERIHNFIQKFYESIFNDINDVYFSNTFKKLGTIEYHIFGQQNFWLDMTYDYRFKFCIIDFIHIKKKKYADQFNFVFKSNL